MADDADLTDRFIEELVSNRVQEIVALAAPRYAEECDRCGVELTEFRRQFGRCIECQERIEKKARVGISTRTVIDDRLGDFDE